MDLQNLKSNKGATKRRKRVGRGNGSGLGTYSGRGMNGQNARSGGKRRPGFEGGRTSFIKKMPKFRGFKNPNSQSFQVVNVKHLEVFEENSTVDAKSLFEKGLISKLKQPVKILGEGELTKKLTVKANKISKSAEEKIKKAKGNVETLKTKAPKSSGPKKGKETDNADDNAKKINNKK